MDKTTKTANDSNDSNTAKSSNASNASNALNTGNTSKTIYLAGGCFWGLQKYMDSETEGVISTQTGYANGKDGYDTVTYGEVCSLSTGFCETVKVVYDSEKTSLENILREYSYTIDPTSLNRQGADIGDQYRTGIYYTEDEDREIIEKFLSELQKKYRQKIVVECGPLKKFIPAEEYHQKYLDKNPTGYCHINFKKIRDMKAAFVDPALYSKASREELKARLTPEQYALTQEYTDVMPSSEEGRPCGRGVYADITTGEPLFASGDLIPGDDGYFHFTSPVEPNVLREAEGILPDGATAAVSRVGMAYMGRVLKNPLSGEKIYRIHPSALMFIPEEDMERLGYGYMFGKIRL